jgi:hypothetical protein
MLTVHVGLSASADEVRDRRMLGTRHPAIFPVAAPLDLPGSREAASPPLAWQFLLPRHPDTCARCSPSLPPHSSSPVVTDPAAENEAWNVLAERDRDAVIQPPKPPVPAAAVLERADDREAEREPNDPGGQIR